jgi:hypothetical protein
LKQSSYIMHPNTLCDEMLPWIVENWM